MIKSVIKRDGSKASFDQLRITNVIFKAMKSVGREDNSLAIKLTKEVVNQLRGLPDAPSVEDVQDFIESVLRFRGFMRILDSFSLYRRKRAEVRRLKSLLRVKDQLKLSVSAIHVLSKRYLRDGESTKQLFRRVARAVAGAERKWGGDYRAFGEEFFNMMSNLEFLPNSPTLMNAGVKGGQLSACFVLPVEDSLDSIFTTLKNTALIHHSGGGVGFNFSNLRPEGDIIKSTNGVSSGPVSFIRAFNVTTDVVKQGGKRRGANMAILNHDHPDIIKFVNAKSGGGFTNFNFSVSVTDSFMNKVVSGGDYWLVNPRNGERLHKVNASDVFNQVVHNAWSRGDPGLVFIDEINRKHPLNDKVTATNPCSESPLLDFESCNLGSINLSKMFDGKRITWPRLERVTRLAVRFLDNVLDITNFPLDKVREVTLSNRKIGLGVMGFADLLVRMGIPYDSNEALSIGKRLMKFISVRARDESMILARKRGSFPNFKKSKLARKYKSMRNATVTTIAPTGSISIIADCSPSIEPLFAIVFTRNILEGTRLLETNKYFEAQALTDGFYSEKLIDEVATYGGVQDVKVPSGVKKVFKTALDIKPVWHVKMQSAFQKHVDGAVSKTVNLPNDASADDVLKVFILAYKLKCKGITVYRYGSMDEQVLSFECRGGVCD